MALGTKTPVMILQELMVKLKCTPEFNLARQSGGTHDPIFEYVVTANNVKATGHGRSKKDAKHDAAKNVLKRLAEIGIFHPDTPEYTYQRGHSPPDSPDEIITMNYVGTLKEFCIDKRLPDPEFNIISDIGPPHARQFTMECSVGTVKCTKTSTTKKSAKQFASKDMLHLLMATVDCGGVVVPLEELSPSFDQEAMDKYEEIKVVTNLSRKIIDYPNSLKEDMEPEVMTSALEMLNAPMGDDVEEHIGEILKKLDINFSIEDLDSSTKKVGLSLRLQSDPPFEIAAYEKDAETAKTTVVKNAIEFLRTMLS